MGQNVVSRKPGQHEEQDRILRQMIESQKKQAKAMEKLVNEVSKLHTVHEVRFSIPHLDEVLEIVKDIQERLAGGGLTQSQEQEQAARLNEAVGPLKAAVEANQ